MKILSNDIVAYIEFLIKKEKLYLSIHGPIAKSNIFTLYNSHNHPYCMFVKNKCKSHSKCIVQQQNILDSCKSGELYQMCYAGVSQYIYPILYESEVIGFIAVSGFKALDNVSLEKQKTLSEEKKIEMNEFTKYSKMFTVSPDKKYLDAIIRPLVSLCESYYKDNLLEFQENTEISNILNYINENHTLRLTMCDLSKKFNYSVSSISHKFKKYTGMSFNNYVDKLRVDNAKQMLLQTDIQITSIALLLGFCNSGHFSAVFKRYTGVCPKDFRKNERFNI